MRNAALKNKAVAVTLSWSYFNEKIHS